VDPLVESDPRQLGPYKIIARLGSGGMGVVFLGSKGSQRVAVKVMRSSFLDSPALRTRFEREIETLKKIKSTFVARYLDSDIEGDLVWHAVEFVNGPTLKEKIENDGPLDEGDWWALYSQMREALGDVHKLGLVHRDLKPANIILSETGLKLIDFGIAQDSEATSLTSTGMVAGSPAWLSPEQLEGTEVGPGSDLFSAGSILTYAALGRSPWGKETTMTVPVAYKKILNRDFDLEALPSPYRAAVSRLFAERSEERVFQSQPQESLPVTEQPSVDIKDNPQQEHLTGLSPSDGSNQPRRRVSRVKSALSVAAVVAAVSALALFATLSLTPGPLENSQADIRALPVDECASSLAQQMEAEAVLYRGLHSSYTAALEEADFPSAGAGRQFPSVSESSWRKTWDISSYSAAVALAKRAAAVVAAMELSLRGAERGSTLSPVSEFYVSEIRLAHSALMENWKTVERAANTQSQENLDRSALDLNSAEGNLKRTTIAPAYSLARSSCLESDNPEENSNAEPNVIDAETREKIPECYPLGIPPGAITTLGNGRSEMLSSFMPYLGSVAHSSSHEIANGDLLIEVLARPGSVELTGGARPLSADAVEATYISSGVSTPADCYQEVAAVGAEFTRGEKLVTYTFPNSERGGYLRLRFETVDNKPVVGLRIAP